MGFFLRWLFAFVLVAATFNPTSFNYVRWASSHLTGQLPLTVLLGLLLLVAWVIYLRATIRSIGGFGILLVTAVVAALLWVLWDWGWLSLDDPDFSLWIGLFAVSLVLGIGMSWSFVRRAISGQYDVDDADEE
ncbi:DUF6524 family protein [Sinisalibacter aestuarii]|uniref:Phage holin family protein n=1 Tax=Sinisalibacter aestuarii TaxID=2949426 RepID=A0ABQ5LUU5_9RHOB|nr:DUF6524 family protein [Sinisalibacter aestuarii]GKY88644.1 hypothetical protein STA1M1_25130 [Sinisalibacter aestuarii]